MSALTERKSPASWAIDGTVAASGVLIGVFSLVSMRLGEPNLHWLVALVLGPAVIVLMSRFPLVLTRGGGGIEVGFDSAVLVFLACYDGGAWALAVWSVGQAASQFSVPKRPDVRCFNVGLGILAGACALTTMKTISSLDRTSPTELFAVALGCAVYFLVDYAISGISIAVEECSPITAWVREGSGPAALGVFVAIDSLGYLGALVVRALPGWASVLLAVPVLTILVATRALSRGNEHRRRLAALFDASAAAQGLQTRAELLEVMGIHTRAVVLSGSAGLREEPPNDREIGARLTTDGADLWMVAPARNRARASVTADQKALETLASVGEQAFARLTLVDEMGRLARHDSLTGLPNRTLFLDRVEQAVARSRRQNRQIAVLFLDLDGFKSVNDRFGHAAGDDLLNTVAERLLRCVREGDSVARLGGDEFAVLLEDAGRFEDVEVLSRRLLDALRTEIVISGHEVVVGTSIGVAAAAPGDDAAALLRNADMAMYRAKALGKNRFFVYQSSLRDEAILRLELIEALRQGIADELVVHYQPVVDLDGGRVTGVEALVRWQRGGVLVQPDEFISAAEQSGLIVELGERVLAQVVADAPFLVAAAGRRLSLGVNMSAHQLREPQFIEQVRAAVVALEDSTLILEMTETVVVQEDEESAAALRMLKDAGALLAIDDFGVGFSSIGYLQHLPVGMLKIDRTFTRDIDSDARAAALVEAILLMGSALDLVVVAEGIEIEAQLDRLRAAGCTIGQGYLFGRPEPLAEAIDRLRADRVVQDAALVGPVA